MSRYDDLMDFLEEMDEKLEDLRETVNYLDKKFERLLIALKEPPKQ